MDPPYPNNCCNLGDSENFTYSQYFQNSQFYSNSNQVHVEENPQMLPNVEKDSRSSKWDATEDVALMSAWCIVSEDSVRGKNQKKVPRWARIKELYDAAQAENPEKIRKRNAAQAYYLTDGIYPPWAAFVMSINYPQIEKHKMFAQHQEAVRKDVERAFGVLQARFAFLRHPCLVWDKDMMGKIMSACIIMHNMIVENERDTYLHYYDPSEFLNDVPTNQQEMIPIQYSTERIANLSSYMTNRAQLRNREAHIALKNDLIEHIWQKFSSHA